MPNPSDVSVIPYYKKLDSPSTLENDSEQLPRHVQLETVDSRLTLPDTDSIDLRDIEYTLERQQELIEYLMEQISQDGMRHASEQRYHNLDAAIKEENGNIAKITSQMMEHESVMLQRLNSINYDIVQLAEQQVNQGSKIQLLEREFARKFGQMQMQIKTMSRIINGSKIYDLYLLQEMREKKHKEYIIEQEERANKELAYTKELLSGRNTSESATAKPGESDLRQSELDLARNIEFQQQKILKHLFGNNIDEQLVGEMRLYMNTSKVQIETLEKDLAQLESSFQTEISAITQNNEIKISGLADRFNNVCADSRNQFGVLQQQIQDVDVEMRELQEKIDLEFVNHDSKQEIKIEELKEALSTAQEQRDIMQEHVKRDFTKVNEKLEEEQIQIANNRKSCETLDQRAIDLQLLANKVEQNELIHYGEFENFVKNQEEYDLCLKVDDLEHRFNGIETAQMESENRVNEYGSKYIELIKQFAELKSYHAEEAKSIHNTIAGCETDIQRMSGDISMINNELGVRVYTEMLENFKATVNKALEAESSEISNAISTVKGVVEELDMYQKEHVEFREFFTDSVNTVKLTCQQCISSVDEKTLKEKFRRLKQAVEEAEINNNKTHQNTESQIVEIINLVKDGDKRVRELKEEQELVHTVENRVLKELDGGKEGQKQTTELCGILQASINNIKDQLSSFKDIEREIGDIEDSFVQLKQNNKQLDSAVRKFDSIQEQINKEDIKIEEYGEVLVLNEDIIEQIKEKMYRFDGSKQKIDSIGDSYEQTKQQVDKILYQFGEIKEKFDQEVRADKEGSIKEMQEYVHQYYRELQDKLNKQEVEIDTLVKQHHGLLQLEFSDDRVHNSLRDQESELDQLGRLLSNFEEQHTDKV